MSGSSPLMRGKLGLIGDHGRHVRLIPAHAGKTLCSCSSFSQDWAHPHSHGENASTTQRPPPLSGSSPLTRGKLSLGLNGLEETRLIPTHARKTWFRRPCRSDRPAHPRSRGESISSQVACRSSAGSSPLTRGKLPIPGRLDAFHRLIPTHAGKTPQ